MPADQDGLRRYQGFRLGRHLLWQHRHRRDLLRSCHPAGSVLSFSFFAPEQRLTLEWECRLRERLAYRQAYQRRLDQGHQLHRYQHRLRLGQEGSGCLRPVRLSPPLIPLLLSRRMPADSSVGATGAEADRARERGTGAASRRPRARSRAPSRPPASPSLAYVPSLAFCPLIVRRLTGRCTSNSTRPKTDPSLSSPLDLSLSSPVCDKERPSIISCPCERWLLQNLLSNDQ